MKTILILLQILFVGCSSIPKQPIERSYLEWDPVLKPEDVFQQTISFSYLHADAKDRLFWVEMRPEENGRSALVYRNEKGEIKDLTPKPFSVRSRLFEYGETPYVVYQDLVYFVNLADQRIYKVNLNNVAAPPVPLTTEKTADGGLGKYGDLVVSPDGRWLVFAYEKDIPKLETVNQIGIIDLQKPDLQESRVLVSGADFYKAPKFSADGKTLAWLQWNHPNMWWDSTFLYAANFVDGKLNQNKKIHVGGSNNSSISFYCFLPDGELIFSADFAKKEQTSAENFYNLYGYRGKKVRSITKELYEFQEFHCEGTKVTALAVKDSQDRIVEVNTQDGVAKEIKVDAVSVSAPVLHKGKMYLVGIMAKSPSQLLEIHADGKVQIIRKSASSENLNEKDISQANAITFPTANGESAHGYFYPPMNSNYLAPKGEKPPVRVRIHGGPTSMTQAGFSKSLLFWTSQGYAIFDVNYRGSTGFGRKYRDALQKKWGIAEVEDIKHGIKYLREQGLISDKAIVSGGSAGGYSVQRLLTYYPDLFAAGASHYGIGNLVTLQKLTHKYESRYLQQLIGGTLETNLNEYKDRSPINHLEKLKSPMVIFQGLDDKVVPPENAYEMVKILKEKGISYEYYEYPGEDHGFRKKENLVTTVTKEAAFFKRILRIERTQIK